MTQIRSGRRDHYASATTVPSYPLAYRRLSVIASGVVSIGSVRSQRREPVWASNAWSAGGASDVCEGFVATYTTSPSRNLRLFGIGDGVDRKPEMVERLDEFDEFLGLYWLGDERVRVDTVGLGDVRLSP